MAAAQQLEGFEHSYDHDSDDDEIALELEEIQADLAAEDDDFSILWPETQDFLSSLHEICKNNPSALDLVGGNVLIHLFDKGTWTLVTKGGELGLVEGATDHLIDFTLACEEFVLHELLDPDYEPDLAEYVTEEMLVLDGDPEVLTRLIKLSGGGQSALSLRCA